MNELILETSDVVMTRDDLERLIASELVAYRDACKIMGDEYTDTGAAKSICNLLNDNGLIEDEMVVMPCCLVE